MAMNFTFQLLESLPLGEVHQALRAASPCGQFLFQLQHVDTVTHFNLIHCVAKLARWFLPAVLLLSFLTLDFSIHHGPSHLRHPVRQCFIVPLKIIVSFAFPFKYLLLLSLLSFKNLSQTIRGVQNTLQPFVHKLCFFLMVRHRLILLVDVEQQSLCSEVQTLYIAPVL